MTEAGRIDDDVVRRGIAEFYRDLAACLIVQEDLPKASMEEVREFLQTAKDVRGRARSLVDRYEATVGPLEAGPDADEESPTYVLNVFHEELAAEIPEEDDRRGIRILIDACVESMMAVSAAMDPRDHVPAGHGYSP